jgi:hypothetical protein
MELLISFPAIFLSLVFKSLKNHAPFLWKLDYREATEIVTVSAIGNAMEDRLALGRGQGPPEKDENSY